MARVKRFFTDPRTLIGIGIAALAIFVLLVADSWRTAALLIESLIIIGLLVWGTIWLWRRHKSKKAANEFGDMLEKDADKAVSNSSGKKREEIAALRDRLQSAIKTIKSSKIGHTSGRAALYELPWYMVIGNPAAGKSTAIINSGLQFPLEEESGKVIHGVGGTRNCDWFFTTEGILLDTAGRFSVHEEDRSEWLGFVDLLKRYRPKAPLNGIIIAVNVLDLTERGPEFAINLAKQLRQRVQELTERLEIFAPVYVLFTKADLIAGFNDFFAEADTGERERVWGVTLPYDIESNRNAVALFDERFDELYRGLKEMSLAQMSMNRGQPMAPGVFTFPLEFASIKPAIGAFINTLFEENPYQFNPVFRGFYFTSALQEGQPVEHSSERVAQRFGLQAAEQKPAVGKAASGFFLSDLFRRVIFADSRLVRQYTSPAKNRFRYAVFFSAVAILGLCFAGWTWSYFGNQQLLAEVNNDLQQAVAVQNGQLDLASRFEALNILEQRIDQLESYQNDRPWSLGLGLYHGDAMLDKLRSEYFKGTRALLLEPVKEKLEAFLVQVNQNADQLDESSPRAAADATGASSGTYERADPTDVKDAYNALKTYLMLGDKSRVDTKHLYDQLTRFWRGWLEANRGGMPREQMIRDAEEVISFYLGHVSAPDWPMIENRLSLAADTREELRSVMAGLPARERVYADIKARASTRFPPVTVAGILGDQSSGDAEQAETDSGSIIEGSYAVSGTFSRQAWEQFIKGAFENAATQELQSEDWVLRTSQSNDLTLQGSPQEIEKSLIDKYKAEYVEEWRKFIQGLTVNSFDSFEQAAEKLNRLGDPSASPLRRMLGAIYLQTAWDNKSPMVDDEQAEAVQGGIVDWFKRVILRRTPHQANRAAYYVDSADLGNIESDDSGSTGAGPKLGAVGAEFSGIAQLVKKRDSNESLLSSYIDALSKVRTRFNQIANEGDMGPGSTELMVQTLKGEGSELASALQYVENQMLPAIPEQQRATIRPLLVRPLVQAYAAVVDPAQDEVNRQWQARVYDTYRETLAPKYPFTSDATVEASGGEIAQVFGPDGAIAKFADENLKTLVIRRGNTLTPRTWADIGLSLTPAFTQNFSQWVSPLGAQGMPQPADGGSAVQQTVFQIQPLPAPGVREYSIVLDGQRLKYRNTPPQWANFVWPNPEGTPGVRVEATTFDGQSVELINFPGRFGLQKMIKSAARERKGDNIFRLSWSKGNLVVAVNLRIISNPQSGRQNKGIAALRLPDTIVGADSESTAMPAADDDSEETTPAANSAEADATPSETAPAATSAAVQDSP
ncbi:type VI secretion system membrane subunit TssM [uncultured Salinisphaera sp.]|uniref:type VI secretion system membrane subunit TssM n=1 Tax=uncultured Salinisphaera sp. TaxID=359372 RepID=UPI0032B29F5D